jgi:signal transduction histidine kinase/CheY-like chemotaxis protein
MAYLSRFLLFLALFPSGAIGQVPYPEQGRPYHVQRYTAQEYGGHDQNWGVVQDARGVVYVANRTSILEYDGRAWRTLTIPNLFTRSIAADERGRVFVGGVGEIGYLAPDSLGVMEYRSLMAQLPEQGLEFADVWTTQVANGAVYFQSFDQIVRWDGEHAKVWRAKTRFHKAFAVNDTYYVRQDGVGLMETRGEDLVRAEGGERFADERIDAMLPLGEATLIVARNEGLLRKRGSTFEPFETDAAAYLKRERVYHGVAVSDTSYALTTFSGTVLVMDHEGHVLRVLGEDIGLDPDEFVLYAYPDRQGGLWLALDSGLMRVDAISPLTVFGHELGLEGEVYDVQPFKGELYAATSQGLFKLDPTDTTEDLVHQRAEFVSVGRLRQQVWSVLGTGNHLLLTANDGVYELENGRARLVMPGRSFTLTPSSSESGLVYVGMKEGLALLRLREGHWSLAARVEGLRDVEVRSVAEAEDGSLWLGGAFNGVVRAWINEGRLARSTFYGEAEGLTDALIHAYKGAEGITLFTPDGAFRATEADGHVRFEPDPSINPLVEIDGETNYLVNTPRPGEVWIIRGGRIYVYAQMGEGRYEEVTPPILRIDDVSIQVNYVEDDGVSWVVGDEGLIRYDPAVEKDYTVPYTALVRRVTMGQDSLIYGGGGDDQGHTPVLAYERNNLNFTFSAPTFNAPEKTEYQYWLEGFDEGWSKWTRDAKKEYTNLPEATYRFRVRARNAQGIISQEDAYAFVVLPPWYRTWWAYLGYVAGATLVVWGYGHLRIRQHRRMLAYEQRINQRLDTANARLREANERLHHADKLKDDFLANTSHELRTPLTAILGFAGVLQEELEEDLQQFAVMIQRGGERLLETVNAMLDMARLQADMVDVQLDDLDVVEAAAEIARGLSPLAEEKGLFVQVMPETRAVPARMDRFCLERILVNLVGNAIKFTDEGGVTILVDATDDEVHLVVRDTGIGIAQDAIPELFDEFHQASTGYGRTHEGNGLGLAITQRIVHMLGGTIDVESRVGGGTTFRVSLPRYDEREHTEAGGEEVVRPLFPDSTRLLIIEAPDRPQTRLHHLLESQCDLDVAVGGSQGLAELRANRYDGVLVDGHLDPLASGQTVLDALRLLPGCDDVPVVAVTGFKMPGDHERFIELGYAGHIAKPFTAQRLSLLLESVLSAEGITEEA